MIRSVVLVAEVAQFILMILFKDGVGLEVP